MDLSHGSEYEAFRTEVQQFLHEHKDQAPRGENMRSRKVLDWQRLLIDNGYTARTIPREYGGFGADPDILKGRIIAEEFANARVSQGLGGQGISMLVPTLLELGTEEQKQQFIKPTIEGEMVWCQGYSEPGAGSDLASLRTSATLDGDEWVVNGQKIWTSTAHIADWIFCLVRTEPDAPKHRGISFLLFRMDTPGIEIRPLVDMTLAANFNETFFTDVHVPKHQIVGERGQGWQVANAILGHERDSLGDPNASLTRLNALTELMKHETMGGQRLIDNPVYRDRLMKIQGRVMAMRFNDMRVLSARLNNKNATLARMITKLQGTELRHDLEGLAIDIMGEVGLAYQDNPYLRDGGSWQSQYMYFLGLIIGGGTSQIQKNIISERGLEMPREPKVEKQG
ncbi:MAG: acyl-CoA dehydrogenase family protein [Pseudomonadales bacterium]|jgi:alkylation response protein AidB-like acyl-CoA dehydrogenase|nr:acyl-CoA dehydrogenase family protein [Pseudomonadales bacterium]MDP6471879.1 acyl-CoA dehydrogenase family protein [Pseudomonadales bacterium]MDP6826851.1 acyl-CoA dehydrogenase family protein [Pseudomonadales bacterium]MDP6970871.1 acyl-CoA dehydrogenase family protein [Pseudomonadales bacterium]|tara:strand:- start:1191 stop:2381 length:1191 start_codon:yes stop_codon:yes gene_type:complete